MKSSLLELEKIHVTGYEFKYLVINVFKKCSGQCIRFSTLRRQFDPHDQQQFLIRYVTTAWTRGFSPDTPASSHNNDPIALSPVSTRDNNISFRTCSSIAENKQVQFYVFHMGITIVITLGKKNVHVNVTTLVKTQSTCMYTYLNRYTRYTRVREACSASSQKTYIYQAKNTR